MWAALWNRARAASARFDQICRSEKSVALPTDKRASPIASAPSDAGRDWPERARPASGGRKPATEGAAWVPLSSPTESPRAAAPMVRYTASAMPPVARPMEQRASHAGPSTRPLEFETGPWPELRPFAPISQPELLEARARARLEHLERLDREQRG